MRLFRASITLASVALISAACVAETPELRPANSDGAVWRAVDGETGKIRDIEGLTALADAFPDSSSVRLRLLNAQLQAGEFEALLDTLRWLHDRGYVFGDVAREQIPKLVGEEYASGAIALLLESAAPIERSYVAWTVPAEAGLVESVYVDSGIDAVAVSSVTGRSVWSKIGQGDWDFATLGNSDNLSGFAGFPGGYELWVASGNIDQSGDDSEYFSGLIGSVPGRDMPRVEAPDGVTLSDLHAADDRTIYASDPLNGGIYKLGPSREAIEQVVAPGTFRSAQGLVTSEDGKLLYVSDYRYGLAIINLETGEISRLTSEIPVILDGTDALFRHGNSLIAIQNGTSPMRISQFTLSEDGLRIVEALTLEQAHSEWTEPLSGHLVGDTLFYVGNGQWDKYVAGELGQGKQPDPTQIRRLPIN